MVYATDKSMWGAVNYKSKLYIYTEQKGIIVYDYVQDTFSLLDLATTPMHTNRIRLADYCGDTLLLIANSEGCVMENGNTYYSPLFKMGEVALAADGKLFWGSNSAGVYGVYERDYEGRVLNLVPGLENIHVNRFHTTANGCVYLAGHNVVTLDQLLYRYNSGAWELVNIPQYNFMTWAFKDRMGTDYILVTQYDGTNYTSDYFDNSAVAYNKTVFAINGHTIKWVETDSAGNKYYCLNNGTNDVLGFNYAGGPVQTLGAAALGLSEGTTFEFIVMGDDNKFYIGTNRGLYVTTNFTNFTLRSFGNNCLGPKEYIKDACTNGDTCYIVSSANSLFIGNATTSLGQKVDSIGNYLNWETRVLKAGYNGQVYITTNASKTSWKNLTTGQQLSINGPVWYFAVKNDFVFADSLVAVVNNHDSATTDVYKNGQLILHAGGPIWATFENPLLGTCFADKYGRLYCINSSTCGQSTLTYIDNNGSYIVLDTLDICNPPSNMSNNTVTISSVKGYCWIKAGDKLLAFDADSQRFYVKGVFPPYLAQRYLNMIAVDSNEVFFEPLGLTKFYYYYRNGQWFDFKRSASYEASQYYFPWIHSYNDNRIILYTQSEGAQAWDLGIPVFDNLNMVKGNVYNDVNNNLVKDNEFGMANVPVSVDGGTVSTNLIGNYVKGQPDSLVVVKIETPPYYIATPDSYVVDFAVLPYTLVDTLNFALYAPDSVQDLTISAEAFHFMPGYQGRVHYTLKNAGTINSAAAVTLKFDTTLSFYHSYYTLTSPPGADSVNFNTGVILPLSEVHANVDFYVSQYLSLGDTLHFSIIVNPLATDTTPYNNVDTFETVVVSSYDPNDKQVWPEGLGINKVVDTGQVLTYTIRFQNTGNAPAINVKLVDTLSPLLNLKSFKYLESSRFCTYDLSAAGVLTVYFDSILLPFKDGNDLTSQGYFKYSIAPADTVFYGDVITNTAQIYFDFNEPIVTNTTVTRFGIPAYPAVLIPVISDTTVVNDSAANLVVYPVPFNNQLHIVLPDDISTPAAVQLYNSSGQMVSSYMCDSRFGTINTAALQQGAYMLNVRGNNGVTRKVKCVKTQ